MPAAKITEAIKGKKDPFPWLQSLTSGFVCSSYYRLDRLVGTRARRLLFMCRIDVDSIIAITAVNDLRISIPVDKVIIELASRISNSIENEQV